MGPGEGEKEEKRMRLSKERVESSDAGVRGEGGLDSRVFVRLYFILALGWGSTGKGGVRW